MPIGGNPFRIAWVVAYPNLATVESTMKKLLSEADYMKMTQCSAGYFLPGSAHDEMWNSV